MRVQRHSLRLNIDCVVGNEMTNTQKIRREVHGNKHRLSFCFCRFRKGKDGKAGVRRRCTGPTFHVDLKDYPTKEMAFFLIAQWHNVPFQNTNIVSKVYRGHVCNSKKAGAEMCLQSAHVSAQTRSQEGKKERGREREGGIVRSCCRAEVVPRLEF